jgi:capsular polysaccharide transport system permease protein
VNLPASAALQFRSIFVLMLQRIRTRFVGSRAGYIWAIIEPICWIFVLKMAFSSHAGQQSPLGGSFEVFFAIGVVLARMWKTTAGSVEPIVTRTHKSGLPTLHKLDSAYATWLLEIVTAIVVLIVILSSLQAFGFDAVPADPLTCLLVIGVTAVYSLSYALAFALAINLAPGLVHFKSIIMLIMFMTSGFATLVDRMPPQLRDILLWNPMVHCIEWFREGFYAGYECASLDRGYLFAVTICFLLLGLAGERALRRRPPARGMR